MRSCGVSGGDSRAAEGGQTDSEHVLSRPPCFYHGREDVERFVVGRTHGDITIKEKLADPSRTNGSYQILPNRVPVSRGRHEQGDAAMPGASMLRHAIMSGCHSFRFSAMLTSWLC